MFTVLIILKWIFGQARWTDGQVKIEIWYLKTAFDNMFLLLKHELFLKSKLN